MGNKQGKQESDFDFSNPNLGGQPAPSQQPATRQPPREDPASFQGFANPMAEDE